MLKRNWNWRNNRLFCHIFVIGEISIGGGPFAYTYAPSEENKKGVRKFSARFLAFSNEISTVQKLVLSSSRGQGNFRGLEASRPRPRTSKCVLETKDVLEDFTSGDNLFRIKSLKLLWIFWIYFISQHVKVGSSGEVLESTFWSPWPQGCRSLLSIGGHNLQFYPNFSLFSTLGGMNLNHNFVQVSKLNKKKVLTKNGALFFPKFRWRPKKRSSPTMEHFFPKFKWTPTLRCTPESNYWGGCRCWPYSSYWGGYSQIIGGINSPIPLGFGTPAWPWPRSLKSLA